MAAPTNIKVIGFDEDRPPMIQPRPCIDLIFQLDQEAPPEWCKIFPSVIGKPKYSMKIDPEVGLFIETWVRKPQEIEAALLSTKGFVADCNAKFDEERARRSRVVEVDTPGAVQSPEQLTLDKLVANLQFDTA